MMNKIEFARKVCEYLEGKNYVDSPRILYGLGIPAQKHNWGRGILRSMEAAGLLKMYGQGKFRWTLVRSDWNRDNPFKTTSQETNMAMNPSAAAEKISKFFNPHCKRCGQPIAENSPISPWTTPEGKGTWVHKDCKSQNPAQVSASIDEVKEKINGHAVCNFTDTYRQRLEGVDSLTEMLADRIKQLEDLTVKQASQIIELQKAQPPREIVLVKPDKKKIKLQQNTHPIFEQVLFHIQAGDDVMLVGPRGCGKSTLAAHLAKALDLRCHPQTISGGVTEAKLFGRVTPDISTGKNIYHPAPFADYFENGGVFLLDEVDGGDPNVLLSLNGCLANGELALERTKNPVAKRHTDFVCLAAANTWGNGADRQYVGRNQQDSAFTERFVPIGMDYDRDLERALCPGADELLERLWRYRDKIRANRLERTVSTRFICRAYKWIQRGKDLEYVDSMLFAGWRDDEIRKAKGGF